MGPLSGQIWVARVGGAIRLMSLSLSPHSTTIIHVQPGKDDFFPIPTWRRR